MRLSAMTLAAAAILLGSAGETSAQTAATLVEPKPRQGYFLGGGLRQGLLSADSETAGGLGLMRGGAFTLRFGEMAGEKFGFGMVLGFAGGSSSDWTGGWGSLQLEGQYAVLERLAIRGAVGIAGLGVARIDETQKREDDPEGTFGTLYTLGASWDFFPWWEPKDGSGGLGLTVFLEGVVLPGDGLTAGGVLAGIEINYWFGFEENRLELPPEAAFEN